MSAFSDVITDLLGMSSEELLNLSEHARTFMLLNRLTGEDLAVTLDVIWKGQRVYPLGTVIDMKNV